MHSCFLRLAYNAMLAALFFVSFGVYHSISEPYIQGCLFGYELPVGYVGLFLGILVIASPKLAFLKNKNFGSLMLLSGLLLFLALVLSPKEYFVNLIHRASFDYSHVDVKYSIGSTLAMWLSFLSFAIGLALWIRGRAISFGGQAK